MSLAEQAQAGVREKKDNIKRQTGKQTRIRESRREELMQILPIVGDIGRKESNLKGEESA